MLEVVLEALDSGGEELSPLGAEALGSPARLGLGRSPRSLLDVVEDRPVVGLHLALGVHRDAREEVPGSVDQTRLPQALWQLHLYRGDEPRLLFVAMRRVKRRLALSWCAERTMCGSPRASGPSRFLDAL